MTLIDTDRKRRGAWFTPPRLVDEIVSAVIDESFVAARHGRPIRIIDPACGDGRFLVAAGAAIRALGGEAEAVGIDIDESTVARHRNDLDAEVRCDDALSAAWLREQTATFDLVIGNPPFLSQMATATSRGGASARGGGPYADAAAEFLSLAADLVVPDGGRVAFVLPQSLLSARDAGPVRRRIDQEAHMIWSAWTGAREFDAQVVTCAVAFEFGRATCKARESWAHVVTDRAGVPPLPAAVAAAPPSNGVLGDRGVLNANFRDEYYGMIPAVGDHDAGPPLITSGLIDPGRSRWGDVPVTFAKRRFARPRVDVSALDEKMTTWALKRLVPKVLVANQTPIIEALCDPTGDLLPGVPVVAIYPADRDDAWEIAAVLTSPSASVWAWHQRGGSGLSSNTIRLGPAMLAELPWPVGQLDAAVCALMAGDVAECGRRVDEAFGCSVDERAAMMSWWSPILERLDARRSG